MTEVTELWILKEEIKSTCRSDRGDYNKISAGQKTGFQETVIEAMNYRFSGRREAGCSPMMMYETYRLFGGASQIVEPFMAALEMIHTYSLIHDDLPAMDNDEYRRGRKTTHVVYGEAMGILAGDGLLNLAYETALTALEMEPENPNVGKALGFWRKTRESMVCWAVR